MNLLKIITFLETLVKIPLVVSILFILCGATAHILDLYNILRNGYFVGIPLFLISLICYLLLRLLRNVTTKKKVTKLLIGLIFLALITIGLYILFSKMMEAVSH